MNVLLNCMKQHMINDDCLLKVPREPAMSGSMSAALALAYRTYNPAGLEHSKAAGHKYCRQAIAR